MEALLVSPYEVDFQPLGISGASAHIKAYDSILDVTAIDATRQAIDYGECERVDVLFISIPVFGSIAEGVNIARRMRGQGFKGPAVFYNQYATVHPQNYFLDDESYVVLGEFEETLCAVVQALADDRDIASVAGVWDGKAARPPNTFKRSKFVAPDRSSLPPLSNYCKTKDGLIIGNVETARGCAHKCGYCSVFAAYLQRVVKIPVDVVMEDIEQCVRLGAQHITFVDADWFSTGNHGTAILQELHERFPSLPFDITARVDNLVRRKDIIPKLKALGCVEITTALEFPKSSVLESLTKQVSVEQSELAIKLLRENDIAIKPTFINFSPYIVREDFDLFDEFISANALDEYLDPMQRETRLLLYKGSPLLKTDFIQSIELIEHEYHYDWVHPDPRVDEYYNAIATPNSSGERKRCCIKG
ncbi:MAG: radical SAM protein [Gammaproteobacteria bacterium]|nr:radical SAM protein [Gammaproteobacteria bacterium]